MLVVYTEKVGKALEMMLDAHKNQLDKAGKPYFYHPLIVASSMPDEVSSIVAILHDVVEDHPDAYSFSSFRQFGEEVIYPLRLLTKDDSMDYFDYIERLASDPIARRVKMADLKHNMDLSRLPVITSKDLKRREKYSVALSYLKSYEKENRKKTYMKMKKSA